MPSSDYDLKVTYEDRGRMDSVERELDDAEEYKKWREALESGAPVYLEVNNLGGVHDYGLSPATK